MPVLHPQLLRVTVVSTTAVGRTSVPRPDPENPHAPCLHQRRGAQRARSAQLALRAGSPRGLSDPVRRDGPLGGFFLPGDSLLFTAGLLCPTRATARGHLSPPAVLVPAARCPAIRCCSPPGCCAPPAPRPGCTCRCRPCSSPRPPAR